MANFEPKWRGRKAEAEGELAQYFVPGLVDFRPYLKTVVLAQQMMNFSGADGDLNGFWGDRFKNICSRGFVGVPFPPFSELTLDDILYYGSKFWCLLNKIEFSEEEHQIVWAIWKEYFGQFMDQKGELPDRLRFLFLCNMGNANKNNPYMFGLRQSYDTHKDYGCENYEDSQHYLAGQVVTAVSSVGGLTGTTMVARDMAILALLALAEKFYLGPVQNGYADAFEKLIWGWFSEILELADPEDTASGRGPVGGVPDFGSGDDWQLSFGWDDGRADGYCGFGVLGETVILRPLWGGVSIAQISASRRFVGRCRLVATGFGAT